MAYPWNYGDILDAVDRITPADRAALIHGKSVTRWGEFSKRTNNLARAMLAGGARAGDKIAFYMRNRPEYSEAIAAGFKARLTHVNVNYRYVDHELIYLLDNSDAEAIVYQGCYAARIWEIRDRLPKVKIYIQLDDGTESLLDRSLDFEGSLRSADPMPRSRCCSDL